MNYRNRELLDLAYQIPCTLRCSDQCGGASEPCHSNQARHGKGKSIKAHDCFFAAGCRACHRELDQGTRYTREEKAEIWQRGYDETMLQLWRVGLLRAVDPALRDIFPDAKWMPGRTVKRGDIHKFTDDDVRVCDGEVPRYLPRRYTR